MSDLPFLDAVHRLLKPRRYCEIGVQHGNALALAFDGTRVVGIDPEPAVTAPIGRVDIYAMTSDDYFSQRSIESDLGGPIDLAFIDGMHLFEYALRDFMNVEAASTPETVVLIDDCLPQNAEHTGRQVPSAPGPWAGDVWKLVAILRRDRPDLRVQLVPTKPTGTAVIQRLDRNSDVLKTAYSAVVDEYTKINFWRDEFASAVGLSRRDEALRDLPRPLRATPTLLLRARRSLRYRVNRR